MFYLRYVVSGLRGRKGRTCLTALGLGVGVGLVVTVAALSSGLDKAQGEVLDPLTGVGTDISVARPIRVERNGDRAGQGNPFGNLSEKEQRQLRRENGGGRFGLNDLGDPGEQFKRTNFRTSRALVRDVRFHDLRHTFGTRVAAAGTPLRTLQEWMGHRDFKTTLLYADYQPSEREAEFVERAFGGGGLGSAAPVGRPSPTGRRVG